MSSLDGIKVLDFTHFIAGPYCTQTLGDHGAEVIKIEPIGGEPSRVDNPMAEDVSLYYSSFNRNKKGMSLDLKSNEGKEIIEMLVKDADILVTNYAAGVPERLGIDYETLSKINPRLIVVHITGFGLTGPYKNESAFDGIIQAMSGVNSLTGEANGDPMKSGIFIADHLAGNQGVIGALLALNERKSSNRGQLVDVSMLDSMVSMLAYNFSLITELNVSPQRAGNRSTNVFSTTFPTQDGYIYIAPLTQKMWNSFSVAIGQPTWANEDSKYYLENDRLKYYEELEAKIASWTKQHNTDEITELLKKHRVACGKINSIEDVLKDPQLKERGMFLEMDIKGKEITVPGKVVKLSNDKKRLDVRPPNIGEHTTEILLEAGFDRKAIDEFYSNKIIG